MRKRLREIRHLFQTAPRPMRALRRWAREFGVCARARRFEALRDWAGNKASAHRKRGNWRKANLWRDRRVAWGKRYRANRDKCEAKQRRGSGVPGWLPSKHADQWRNPHNVPLSSSSATTFKQILWNNGYLSPNFTRYEARSKDGTAVPSTHRGRAQYHAFALERVRARLGGRALRALSWYRSPFHNRRVGGATNSQHLYGWATDWSSSVVDAALDRELRAQFSNGGIGVRRATGRVAHVDNGPARRWFYG